MNVLSLILGETGTGKSRSIKNLDPKKTVILNCEMKALPFRSKFPANMSISNPNMVYFILNVLCMTEKEFNENKEPNLTKIIQWFKEKEINPWEVETVILDSFSAWQMGYLEQLKANGISGFDLWGKYAEGITKLMKAMKLVNAFVFVTAHTEFNTNADGETVRTTKVKGKEWEGVVEREFTCVFFTDVLAESADKMEYRFLTNRDGGSRPAKTPEEMFPLIIPNDLAEICNKFKEYYGLHQ